MKSTADVAVVGGGVIGLALARELSSRGVDVVVVERGSTGEEASSAAAGLLSAQSDAAARSSFSEFAIESRDLYPGWTAAIEEETGIGVGWQPTGVLLCGPADVLDRFGWQFDAGLPLERLGPADIERCSSGRAGPHVTDALFFPRDSVVNNRLLVRALRRSLEVRGVP
ncbi:MAG TPA: FAD-dependent oxidoreductase, partial [Thermoanaerobaculia bacterium]